MVSKFLKPVVVGLFAVMTVSPISSFALPFNTDLSDVQLRAGSMMRPKAKNSVPVGSLEYRVEDKEAALLLSNPLAGDANSSLRGQQLFSVNCSPCHGDITSSPYVKGPVAQKSQMLGIVPDLKDELYKAKPDGHFYGIIHFGGMAVMPALGWKLSPTEHWDIVNYIRKVQNSK
jgi:mono/diheme cytochrome c family protein